MSYFLNLHPAVQVTLIVCFTFLVYKIVQWIIGN